MEFAVRFGNGEIAAVSSTNFKSDKIGIWMIKGKIVDIRK
jgi:hypothetical protein